jgi:hypothetical protein
MKGFEPIFNLKRMAHDRALFYKLNYVLQKIQKKFKKNIHI